MASVIAERRGDKTLYRIQYRDQDRRRHSIRLGDVTKKDAAAIGRKIEALLSNQISGNVLDPSLAEWVDRLGDDLHGKLRAAGLVAARKRHTLADFIDEFIASRPDAKPNTVRNWRNSQIKLVEFFDRDRDLRSISRGDADDWRQSLVNKKLSMATISKAVKHAKQFLRAAFRKGFTDSNPFDDLKAGGERNPERAYFVDRDTFAKVLAKCPNAEWRLLLNLCRFGGLRCPSEILSLQWGDILWDARRIVVRSPKTVRHHKSSRVIPLFPELVGPLREAFEQAEDGSVFVISRYRDASVNLRSGLLKIIHRAGVQPWERLYQNLRSSRQTELEDRFASHIVCSWMGNTENVARAHYLQTTDAHFDAAVSESGGATGGAHLHHQGEKVVHHRTATNGNEKQQTQEASGVTTLGIAFPEASELTRVPPRGVEFSQFSAKNGQFLDDVVQRVVHEPSSLARAISLANSGLSAAAAGEALAAISSWIRHLAQLHKIEATIDSQSTLCQVVDALVDGDALSRTQATQVDTMVAFLSACVYGAPRSPQSLSAILESAAVLLQGK